MGLAITDTYNEFRPLFDKETLTKLAHGDDPLDFENLFRVHRGKESARLHDAAGPMIIIAGSGMVTGGRILGHLREGLPSRARRCSSSATKAWPRRVGASRRPPITGDRVDRRRRDRGARQGRHVEGALGSCRSQGAPGWMRAIPDVRRVALHHGDVESQDAFVSWASTQNG